MQRKGQARTDQTDARGQPRRIVKPDRHQPQRTQGKGGQGNSLARPEDGRFAFAGTQGLAQGLEQKPDHSQNQKEDKGEDQLAAVACVHAEQPDAINLHIVRGAYEFEPGSGHLFPTMQAGEILVA